MLKKRREMKSDKNTSSIEYAELFKTIRKKLRDHKRMKNTELICTTIEKSCSLKEMAKRLQIVRKEITSLSDKDGNEIINRDKILNRIKEFYEHLYESKHPIANFQEPEDAVPEILIWEVENAISEIKYNKAIGRPDDLEIDLIKAGGEPLAEELEKLFSRCLEIRRIPEMLRKSNLVISYKKGNKKELKTYRPISLLPLFYKIFTKIITKRIEKKLYEAQTTEQAGFRKWFSTMDHIHTINQLREKCDEYNLPLCLTFVDFEKAFDSVEIDAILKCLVNQGIEPTYIHLLRDI